MEHAPAHVVHVVPAVDLHALEGVLADALEDVIHHAIHHAQAHALVAALVHVPDAHHVLADVKQRVYTDV